MRCCDNPHPHIHAAIPLVVLAVVLAIGLLIVTVSHALASHLRQASWYDDGPGYYGAVHSFRWGDERYPVEVCRVDRPTRCVTVVVRDHMANRHREIDLSPAAFAELAPLSRGVVDVTVRRVDLALPATDTWVVEGAWTDQQRVIFWAALAAAYVTVRRMLRRFLP